ncbi:cob(I)yrinic acid a,c-diamide adenosyltransferase [Paenibacillus alvei]|uniref:Corrinoid adenosyltransferase n=1 Tax=Paenibacillus alvei TaxID=44250 RepID=A0ABT4H2Q0_PAEAL|nr:MULTISPECIES: cob(I)yrinic acid a,c-diamide adenosyltransferase [Paenibacillus]EJW16515.1 Cob(I)yrinic acid a,c-diamide adenosyltransferase [Paenibacillus alvei DSM 29]MCY7484739.1 cob(I)yrinic acid a,c-diamide adenosyltransferase [Paenibacillus alvei]MCY9542397.1 cob(I)yrinic acid a,c-diamide adenosyltransferase [Paenibacillus alvei]MCY9704248.1 cob(I)yrinic acid a,c-diamide adenosyltransferase [Paenibacillus alvei]MCY9733483.1 cob(I)yrinic acid a,c-diamide adenosyltransferase [Paenibacill
MKLYTRTGDEGTTSLIGGRVPKDHLRVTAYGELDELNSFVGWAITCCRRSEMEMLREQLSTIQHELFDCGADIAYAEKKQGKFIYKIRSEQVEQLEKWVDEHEAANAPITKFILPGGSETAAALHVCRTVCRRAERQLVTLSHQETVHVDVMKYVNRLSDYFFAAARRANMLIGVQDQEYVRSADVFGKKEQHD